MQTGDISFTIKSSATSDFSDEFWLMCPYISFQRPGWLLQLSLSTCNKSRWVCSLPFTSPLLTSADPDTNTHIKKTGCGGKIGQRLLLPFSTSSAVAKALIWTGWVAFPWFSSILHLSLIQEFWIQVGRRLRPTWPCRCHATNHIHLEQRWIWFHYSILLNNFQLDIARIMRILLIVNHCTSLEWVKKGKNEYCRKRRDPLTLPWDLSWRRSLFWAGSTNLFHSHLQKYFQHAKVVDTWGHQTLNPRKARQSAIMFSALKTPQLPIWLTTGEISKRNCK